MLRFPDRRINSRSHDHYCGRIVLDENALLSSSMGSAAQNRTRREMGRAIAYSGLMPAARTTLAHFPVSSAISLPNSPAEPGSGSPPMAAKRAFIPGSARAALISLLSLSTISAGVFAGAPLPYHWLVS